jgi:hypothetical protein
VRHSIPRPTTWERAVSGCLTATGTTGMRCSTSSRTQAPDPEFSRDNVSFFDRFDLGLIGYPTASGMLPYWLDVASNPQAPADQRALAEAVNRLHPILVSDREEPVPWQNAELLVVHDDDQLASAVRREKEKPGKDLGAPAAPAPPRPSSTSGSSTSTSSPCTRSRSAPASRYSPAKTTRS